MLAGRATPDGTARYAARFADSLAAGHYRDTADGLHLASIGLGTYLGRPDEATDRAYDEAIRRALGAGVNVVDSAINYRHMRSERCLGRALGGAVAAGEVARDEIVVSTKGGFLAFDGALPADPRGWFTEHYLVPGIVGKDDFVAQCHAINPEFLDDQLQRSLANLGLETIDIYYLHNPETQRSEVGHDEFVRRLRAAFEFLERQVTRGRIAAYGLATWRGLRVDRAALDFLGLDQLLALAREVGGEAHHLRAIQLPFNPAMTEALTLRRHTGPGPSRSTLEVAAGHRLTVMTSASIHQGRFARESAEDPAGALDGPATPAQRALQYARSAPGVTTALVGTTDRRHLAENMGTARHAPLSPARFGELFGPGRGDG